MAASDKARLMDPAAEVEQAKTMAARYRCEYVDLREASIDHDLFRSIPADLMLRYGFVPYQRDGASLVNRPTREGNSALDAACEFGHTEVAALLRAAGGVRLQPHARRP